MTAPPRDPITDPAPGDFVHLRCGDRLEVVCLIEASGEPEPRVCYRLFRGGSYYAGQRQVPRSQWALWLERSLTRVDRLGEHCRCG